MKTLLAFPLLLAFWAVPASAQSNGETVIHCWDEERRIVQPKRRRTCAGVEVSGEDAARLNARYKADRRSALIQGDRIKRAERARPFRFHSAGTAFAINAEGVMLTSAHVVEPCHAVELRIPGAVRRLPVEVLAMDAENDLAVVRSDYRAPAILRLAPYLPEQGEPVGVLGFPHEGKIRLEPKLTPATVNYDLSDPRLRGLLGVVGAVRRGHSGGPVLDSRGRVIGVLKAKIDSVAAHRLSGAVLKDLGVVTEARAVAEFLEKSRTRYGVDGSGGREQTVRGLTSLGAGASARIDCLVRS